MEALKNGALTCRPALNLSAEAMTASLIEATLPVPSRSCFIAGPHAAV
jgi:hypothetical protein